MPSFASYIPSIVKAPFVNMFKLIAPILGRVIQPVSPYLYKAYGLIVGAAVFIIGMMINLLTNVKSGFQNLKSKRAMMIMIFIAGLAIVAGYFSGMIAFEHFENNKNMDDDE